MFRASFPLRFAHCDYAGIAYYPRCFELCDAAIEDWAAQVLNVDRRTMHHDLGLGMPTVDLHATFAAPGRLGDMLDFDVAVVRVGDSSVDFAMSVTCGGAPRFTVAYTQVLMHLADVRAVPWPAPMRAALHQHLEPGDPA